MLEHPDTPGKPDLSKLSPEMRANYIRNISPTQFETERGNAVAANGGTPVLSEPNPSLGTIARSVISDDTPTMQVPAGVDAFQPKRADVPANAYSVEQAKAQLPQRTRELQQFESARRAKDEERTKAHGRVYAAAAKVAPLAGVDVDAIEHAGDIGDTSQVVARTAPQAAAVAAPLIAEGIAGAAGALRGVGGAASTGSAVDRLIGTTPERMTELKQFPQKITAVQKAVQNAEQAAKVQAKAAFPKLEKPIVIDAGEPAVDTGAMDANGAPIMQGGKPPVTTTWEALQEQRSDLLKNIAKEKVAIAHGQKPAFDIGDMYENLHQIDNTMSKAALEQGGQPALDQLEAARTQWRKYMDDFHNKQSPLRDIIEAKPDETAKIVGKLTGRDSGPRALETLRRNGANTAEIEKLLSRGKQPLAVDVTESGKLRSAGSDTNYKRQRLNESIQQATVNRMPSRAEASLPAKSLKSANREVLGTEIPLSAPRTITKFRLGRALKALDGSPTP